jgi:hypothetical protein
MADERLLSIDEFLLEQIVTVMHDGRAMTAAEIARAASTSSARKIDRRSVEKILMPLAGGVVTVSGVPPRMVLRRRRRRLLQQVTRWQLVEAPASPPDTAGALVPAWPHPPTLSGAAAAPLTFRDDEPPTNAIGKFAGSGP